MNWFRQHAGEFSGQILFEEPLARHTYYRIGGPAAVLLVPKSIGDLQWVTRGAAATGLPLFIMGAGSNLLVSDRPYSGVVIKAGRLSFDIARVEGREHALPWVRTGSGVAVSSLLRRAAQEGWGGLEFLTGIPGTVGGVVAMNAGTHLGEAKDRLRRVEVYDLLKGEMLLFESGKLNFQYRKNLFLPKNAVVLSADWEIRKDEPNRVRALIDETLARRKGTQPLDFPSCGSVFKNPRENGLSAWQVVDKLGLRGHQIGGARFSEKHSNFILNLGSASAQDVRDLIELAQARALGELGIHLEEEVKYLGDWT